MIFGRICPKIYIKKYVKQFSTSKIDIVENVSCLICLKHFVSKYILEISKAILHIKIWYSSKCSDTFYTTNISRPKYFNSFREEYILRILGHLDRGSYTWRLAIIQWILWICEFWICEFFFSYFWTQNVVILPNPKLPQKAKCPNTSKSKNTREGKLSYYSQFVYYYWETRERCIFLI